MKRFPYFIIGCVRLARHALAHLFSLNSGQYENWLSRSGKLMTGKRCHHCGKMTDIHPLIVTNSNKRARL